MNLLPLTVAYYASEWLIRIVMTVEVTRRRRRPTASMAWLLVIYFLPWFGLALYFLIGRNLLPAARIRRVVRLREKLQTIEERFENHPLIVAPELDPRQRSAVELAQKLGYMPILGENDAQFITESDQFISRLIEDIDGAANHVHLLFYIFSDDAVGMRVIEALERVAKRGVKCRVLVDAAGSRPLMRSFGQELPGRGVDLREALPVSLFRRQMARIDLRNHRKLAVIDGRIAYTGSQNIIDPSYGHKSLSWRDMMARLGGPVVLELQAVFVGDWYCETGEFLDGEEIFPEPVDMGETPVQTLPSGPSYPTENYQRMVSAALHAATQRVIITTPYFVPDESLMHALELACLRGVLVELILPRKCDQIMVGAASRSYYETLLELGVRVHLYDAGLLHSKTMTIDDSIAFLGSSNFDVRSFALNFEINLVFYGARETTALRKEQLRYMADAFELTEERWDARPVAKKLFQNVAKLMSPLL